MPVVSIRHLTAYRYRNPVGFGEHRMMFRPLESHDQRVLSAKLTISPQPEQLRHVHDLFGNSVGVARFARRSDTLIFDSRVRIEHRPGAPFDGSEAAVLGPGPFAYDAEEQADLARFIARQWADPAGEVAAWAQRFVGAGRTSLQDLLTEMTHAIRQAFAYNLRLAGPPQSPLQTLALRRGSCRDFAVLMIEAARSLGLAAQFVSGYVYSASSKTGRSGGGHSHAWARVYVPACGWVDFDPTNGIVGGADLIRVATARDPRQALPLHGTWAGAAEDFLRMDVTVDVVVEPELRAQPASHLRVAQAG